MTDVKVEKSVEAGGFVEERVTMDNSPDLGDKTGEVFLNHMEDAIKKCRQLISGGFRLVDFWSDTDQGIQFILKKRKK